ncbi:hypothetical protein CROQUDRAFT_615849 [Cronartium quercuum f. sp. fusiforme G11]|uniref:Uncharacterized protein n=1 Tax=Cronartium quercuum f. sp. fusiforme G11 TaxID=708437 RepID=A0A9P6NIC0_9BASI|nr:hypothetical protein CROQUDRAFT_615849 [Cronartium quercuum f. sp. fusiforme G11]
MTTSAHLLQAAMAKLALLPPTENPYTFASELLDEAVYPKYHPVVFGSLIFFAVIHATIIVCCVSVIIIPFKSGQESRKNNLWLYRKRFVKEFETPYYLPNSSMGVAITQLFTSICFITFIFLAYRSYQSPAFQRACYLLTWYGFSYLPGYIGLYVTAWNACLTCLTFRGRDGRAQELCRYLPPKVVNVMVLTVPMALIVFCVTICVLVGEAIRDFNKSYESLDTALQSASESWARKDGEVNLGLLLLGIEKLGNAVDHLSRNCRLSTSGWMFWILLLLLCYAFAVSFLLRLLKKCVIEYSSTASSEINTCFANPAIQAEASEEGSIPQVEDALTHWTFVPAARASKLKLEKCFSYMVRHCSFMFLAILYDLAVTVVMYHASSHLIETKWRSVSLLVSLFGTILVSPAMILQAWRAFTERDCFQNSPSVDQNRDLKSNHKNVPLKTKQSSRISERVRH